MQECYARYTASRPENSEQAAPIGCSGRNAEGGLRLIDHRDDDISVDEIEIIVFRYLGSPV